ncbi:MAG: hypothetical protein WAK16_08985 [Candidatus Cybelea sp.]
MIQTNLNYDQPSQAADEGPCLGRLLFTWGLYGLAMTMLWRVPHHSAWAAAALWAIAGLVALAVMVKLGEI